MDYHKELAALGTQDTRRRQKKPKKPKSNDDTFIVQGNCFDLHDIYSNTSIMFVFIYK